MPSKDDWKHDPALRYGIPDDATAIVMRYDGEQIHTSLVFPVGVNVGDQLQVHVNIALHALEYIRKLATEGPPEE